MNRFLIITKKKSTLIKNNEEDDDDGKRDDDADEHNWWPIIKVKEKDIANYKEDLTLCTPLSYALEKVGSFFFK